MRREAGTPGFPVWLLGDSNPPQWEAKLAEPLDSRHPIRHNIWTSALEVAQADLYAHSARRFDAQRAYVRNAIAAAATKPKRTALVWDESVMAECDDLGHLIRTHDPWLICSFGAFAFEFARRALGEEPVPYGHRGAQELGAEFRVRSRAPCARPRLVPLLHRTISGGRFLESHEAYCGTRGSNYFEMVGHELARLLRSEADGLPIWASSTTPSN
jgi:hypothetical protein